MQKTVEMSHVPILAEIQRHMNDLKFQSELEAEATCSGNVNKVYGASL